MVTVFDLLASDQAEQVVYCHDAATGLRAIVAIHSTALGPALGGTRFKPYPSEQDALVDVIRLSKGMTYKHAAAGLDRGGGKAVIIGDPGTLRSEALIRAYGRFVDGLGGRYLTAEDVGTTQADMDLIRRETRHVTGVSESLGGSGDPSPATALGVQHAIRAAVEHRFGDASLAGRHVVVSGVGKVGSSLVERLLGDGARVTVADVREEAVQAMTDRHAVEAVPADRAHRTPADVFAPCALGAVLSETTIAELACDIVCGSANNQLASDADGKRLADRDVLYVPDFVANAGGVVNIAEESAGYDRDRAEARIKDIAATTRRVLARAASAGITPAEAADRLAEERIEQITRIRLIRTTTREQPD